MGDGARRSGFEVYRVDRSLRNEYKAPRGEMDPAVKPRDDVVVVPVFRGLAAG